MRQGYGRSPRRVAHTALSLARPYWSVIPAEAGIYTRVVPPGLRLRSGPLSPPWERVGVRGTRPRTMTAVPGRAPL